MRFNEVLTNIAAVALVLLCGRVAAADQTPSSAANAGSALDTMVEQRMKDAGIVGLGAAIIVNRKVVWTKGYGFADKQHAVPFTPDTVMNIGSISKTITGAALMRAVQEGKLSLDEDINTYLPFKVVNPHNPSATITLRHLATHTSGITDRWEVLEKTYRYGDAPEPLYDFVRSYFTPGEAGYSRENFLNFKPGTRREYSNVGADLAGF